MTLIASPACALPTETMTGSCTLKRRVTIVCNPVIISAMAETGSAAAYGWEP